MGSMLYGIGQRGGWPATTSWDKDGSGEPLRPDGWPFLLIDWTAPATAAVYRRVEEVEEVTAMERGLDCWRYSSRDGERVLLPLPTLETSGDLDKLLRLMGVPQIVDDILLSQGREGLDLWPFGPEHIDDPAGLRRQAGLETVVEMGPRDFALMRCAGDGPADMRAIVQSPALTEAFLENSRELWEEIDSLPDVFGPDPVECWRIEAGERGCIIGAADPAGWPLALKGALEMLGMEFSTRRMEHDESAGQAVPDQA